jgi:hypothetical protein
MTGSIKALKIRRPEATYAGFSDKRIRQFRLVNRVTGDIFIIKGCTLAQACLYLDWDRMNVEWVDLGSTRAKDPVYLSTDGWREIEPPLHPIRQPRKE